MDCGQRIRLHGVCYILRIMTHTHNARGAAAVKTHKNSSRERERERERESIEFPEHQLFECSKIFGFPQAGRSKGDFQKNQT